MIAPRWLVLTWRLPSTLSSPRVATWRSLQRLGAVSLTPGAVIVPYTEHLLEQLEWVAEDITQRGGDAYVLPVTELPEADEDEIERRMRSSSSEEYRRLRDAAQDLARRSRAEPDYGRRVSVLERGFARTMERDHFKSTSRTAAERAIKLALKRQNLERET
jgi:hypothetical protein